MYFKEKEEEKVLISDYVKELEKKLEGEHFLQDEKEVRIGKYLVSLFDDQEMDKSLIKEFILRLYLSQVFIKYKRCFSLSFLNTR